MKLSAPKIGVLAAIVITIIVVILFVPINGIRAKSQLNEGVSAFRDRKYDEAEKYARQALELDPNNGDAPLLLAASLQAQYRRNEVVPCYDDMKSDKNRKRAEEAIELFKKMAANNPNEDKLFKAVAGLYDSLSLNADQQATQAAQAKAAAQVKETPPANEGGAAQPKPTPTPEAPEAKPLKCNGDPNRTINWDDEEKKWRDEEAKWTAARRQWVEDRAKNGSVDPSKRAEAYLILASKNCECSKGVTDANKQNVQKPDGSVVIQYKKPANEGDYTRAESCINEGLQQTKQAIDLSESPTAWEQMYCLRLEYGKLYKMNGDEAKAKEYEDLAAQARDKVKQLHDQAKPASGSEPQPAG